MRTLDLSLSIMRERMRAGRMLVIWPLLTLSIILASWGLSNPLAVLPVELDADSAYDLMYVSTVAAVFTASMSAVIISFDGVSRDRLSGVLEVKLTQPIPRRQYAMSMLLGHWAVILVPVTLLNLISILIIWYYIGDLPSLAELFVHIFATALFLFWWTAIQLLASTWTKDMGSSIATGIGVWMIFVFFWLIIPTVVAGLLGVGVENLDSEDFKQVKANVDLFSPNGMYHHLLEMQVDGIDRGTNPVWISLAAIIWSILPAHLLIRRMERIEP